MGEDALEELLEWWDEYALYLLCLFDLFLNSGLSNSQIFGPSDGPRDIDDGASGHRQSMADLMIAQAQSRAAPIPDTRPDVPSTNV